MGTSFECSLRELRETVTATRGWLTTTTQWLSALVCAYSSGSARYWSTRSVHATATSSSSSHIHCFHVLSSEGSRYMWPDNSSMASAALPVAFGSVNSLVLRFGSLVDSAVNLVW